MIATLLEWIGGCAGVLLLVVGALGLGLTLGRQEALGEVRRAATLLPVVPDREPVEVGGVDELLEVRPRGLRRRRLAAAGV